MFITLNSIYSYAYINGNRYGIVQVDSVFTIIIIIVIITSTIDTAE